MHWIGIETSTKNCSVAVFHCDELLHCVEEVALDKYIHAEKLHTFVGNALEKAMLKFSNLQAVMIGSGPGSYTGLRIGASAAKGYAFSLQKPLMSISSLDVLHCAWKALSGEENHCIAAIDARRMEAFIRIYRGAYKSETHPHIFTSESFLELQGTIALVGDAAEKSQSVLTDNRFSFYPIYPSARWMGKTGWKKLQASNFEDVAYFVPTYGKDFVAGKKSSKIGK
ncbi:MAG: tRNA (adenosine(37)-N6)-threonylcarbamoyltransferase complex dimerization subunit type 1 TsaB [Cryomorphaceae bacterium]|nr:tRNA (adenosine(37)-N6)-threonylcarbamoyltransferase complex dimerization subunit type 1 TsaB [Cryomorphaceae bacterium]